MRSALCEWHLKQLDLGFGDIAWWLDRSQSLFYFVPQESHRQAGSSTSGCKIPALGKSLGPRGMYFPFSHHWQGSIAFNTVRTTRPTGMYFLIHP